MQYFSNLELIKNLASQIVKDRKYNYNEDQLSTLYYSIQINYLKIDLKLIKKDFI
jgi:hypothetical protein